MRGVSCIPRARANSARPAASCWLPNPSPSITANRPAPLGEGYALNRFGNDGCWVFSRVAKVTASALVVALATQIHHVGRGTVPVRPWKICTAAECSCHAPSSPCGWAWAIPTIDNDATLVGAAFARAKLNTAGAANALAAPAVLSLALANAAPTKVASLSIVGIAHAQPHGELGAWQEHSAAVQIFQGLTGTVPRPTWWIWVASATTSADAVTLATRLNTQHPSLPKRFKAYPSPSGAGLFAVMLGDGFGSQQEAAGLAELARARGMQETPRIVEVRDRTPAR